MTRDASTDSRYGRASHQRHGLTDQQYSERIREQEGDIDMSYFSQGLEFPEGGMGAISHAAHEGATMPHEGTLALQPRRP